MSSSNIALILGIALANVLSPSQPANDPLIQPIAPQYAQRWLTPLEPGRVFGNTYFVGFAGLGVALIHTSDGLILIDGGVPQAVPVVEANIRQLGFRLGDVRFILSTEPHWDHAGGIAALARDSGAIVIASAPAAEYSALGGDRERPLSRAAGTVGNVADGRDPAS